MSSLERLISSVLRLASPVPPALTLLPAGAAAGATKTGESAPPTSCQSTFDTIAFEGGGTRGIIYGGAAIALEEAVRALHFPLSHSLFSHTNNLKSPCAEQGLLQSACNFAGTSAGSQSAALLAAGYTACELQKELLDQNFLRFVMDKETSGRGDRCAGRAWFRHRSGAVGY